MYDLVVVGGGVGGLSVARRAAGVGARVAVIERSGLGGPHAHSAGVPSKALLHAARAAAEIRRAATLGIQAGEVSVSFPAMLERIRAVSSGLAEQARAELARSGVDIVTGTAAFEAYDTVLVEGQPIAGRRFVIATGSRPALPRIPGLTEAGALDHAGIWSLAQQPASLVILGAGPDAVEWAQAFARLGTRVTILTESDRLLPEDDRDVSELMGAVLAADGVTIRAAAKVAGVGVRDGRKVVTYRVATEVDPSEAVADQVLVAESRLANVEALNLEAVGIFADPFDGIPVDDYLQTRAPTISALGDVLGHHRWAHAAAREAEIVFRNAILRLPRKMNYNTVPRVLYTDPEVATVGLTAAGAADTEPPIHCVKVDLAELDRARIDGATQGFAKVLADGSGRVLGATVVAPQASAVIMEFVLAMDRGLSLCRLANSAHPEPSYAGLAHLAASRFCADRRRTRLAGSLLRWFYGYDARERAGRV